MCGNNFDKLAKGIVEGVIMSICENCMKYAKPIHKKETQTHSPPSKIYARKNVIKELESREHVVENFADIIRNTRQKMQIPQKALAVKLAEKESVIHSLETGKHEPSIMLARKIERVLNVKLVTEDIESDDELLKSLTSKDSNNSDKMTLGDAITIRKRK